MLGCGLDLGIGNCPVGGGPVLGEVVVPLNPSILKAGFKVGPLVEAVFEGLAQRSYGLPGTLILGVAVSGLREPDQRDGSFFDDSQIQYDETGQAGFVHAEMRLEKFTESLHSRGGGLGVVDHLL